MFAQFYQNCSHRSTKQIINYQESKNFNFFSRCCNLRKLMHLLMFITKLPNLERMIELLPSFLHRCRYMNTRLSTRFYFKLIKEINPRRISLIVGRLKFFLGLTRKILKNWQFFFWKILNLKILVKGRTLVSRVAAKQLLLLWFRAQKL